ncbi:ABC transporter ATP-binding protein [Pelagibius litoralis]|uniref:ABC transporter ATP-binding protein n=1 Tax=Pelagibius litoralis TaxID=374515 RepID=A0A967F1N9_9PROT|nr:ABC transporter ATP-binding protein [Pelagibius litoralis]NIA71469.1 ABC transporter ATP-binding protein [Pelagibius litoralis]
MDRSLSDADSAVSVLPQRAEPAGDVVLEVRNLSTEFSLRTGVLKAVDDISFTLRRGETLCIVGESGSGKSVTARSILRIVQSPGRVTAGEILLHGVGGDAARTVDMAKLDSRGSEVRSIRGKEISMIFQEPMSSLSPVHKIGFQIDEALKLHTDLDKKDRRTRTIALLRRVEIPDPETTVDRYPFEYSGGMRQRAMIAMALACNPSVLIADEPTTALDVTTQAEILDLIKELQTDFGMAVIFITHDMGVVAEIADTVCVMRHGAMVESGPVGALFKNPQHPYSRMLIGSALRLERPAELRLSRPRIDEHKPPILRVENLEKDFAAHKGFFRRTQSVVRAVADVSLQLREGENLGIVGESGSGKTTLGRCLLRMIEPTAGSVFYRRPDGSEVDISCVGRAELRQIYREIRMIFQDPFGSLNPRMTIEQIVGEPLLMMGWKPKAVRERVVELMERVDLKATFLERYPHAFSGGQRQRISIARALAPSPRVIVADEATSALDVSLRAQVLDLLLSLQAQMNLSFLFISHDISVIRYFCDRVAVMYRGEIVEIGDALAVCDNPQHAYTKALLSAVPRPDPTQRRIHERHRYVASG